MGHQTWILRIGSSAERKAFQMETELLHWGARGREGKIQLGDHGGLPGGEGECSIPQPHCAGCLSYITLFILPGAPGGDGHYCLQFAEGDAAW